MTAPRHRLSVRPSRAVRRAARRRQGRDHQPADASPAELPPSRRAMPVARPPIHRKAVDLGAPARRENSSAAEFELQYPTAELRRPPVAPVSWTPDGRLRRGVGRAGARAVDDDVPSAGADAARRRRRRTGGRARRGRSTRDPLRTCRTGPRRVAPPRDVVDIVEQATGVHVGDTIIDRSPEISDRASDWVRSRSPRPAPSTCRPSSATSTIRTFGRSSAHELSHVAQHRITQGELPHEDSPEGRRARR